MRYVIFIVLALAAAGFAQPPKPSPEPIPAEAIIEDLASAYSQVTAEEVQVRFRAPQGSGLPERTDRFTIRIDPGDGAARPRRILLELGNLRAYFASGKMTAVNSSAPDKFLERAYQEPLTPARLAEMLPPLNVPQLALACGKDPQLKSPIPALTGVNWKGSAPDESARPVTVAMQGDSPSGSIEVTVNVKTARLVRLAATIRNRAAEGTLELQCRPLDPGNAADWAINTEGRKSVASLQELHPSPRPMQPLQAGQLVPPLTFSRVDLSALSLGEAMDAAKPQSAAILFIRPMPAERTDAIMKDARAGAGALRMLHDGKLPPAAAPDPQPPRFVTIAALCLDLQDFSKSRWQQLRSAWSPPSSFGGDDLLWVQNSPIDRFTPGAAAAIVVIQPDRTLAGVVPLDGRAEEINAIAAELLALLRGPPR